MDWFVSHSTRLFAIAALIVGVGYSIWYSIDAKQPQTSTSGEAATKDFATELPAANFDPLAERMDKTLAGVVRLETIDQRTERIALGTGFLVDHEGTVLTCLHVIKEAVRVEAVFADGSRLVPDGILAADPTLDLALLRLPASDKSWTPLPLAEESSPKPLDNVVSIGHPLGYSFSPLGGQISRVIHTSELPSDSHRFVNFVLGTRRNHSWIQHTSPITDGNSGGPLLNGRGEVVGINAWINTETGLSYALSGEHLREFIARPRGTPMSLTEMRASLSKNSPSIAIEEAQLVWRELSQNKKSLSQLGDRDLDLLAETISAGPDYRANEVEREALGALRGEIAKQAQGEEDLAGRLAGANSRRANPGNGLIAVTSRMRIVRGDLGRRALLATVEGSEIDFLIPLAEGERFSSQSKRHLLLGVLSDEVVPYGANPLDRRFARVLTQAWYCPLRD